MPNSGKRYLSKLIDCFRCCANTSDQSGDQYSLQPLNLFNPRGANGNTVEELVEQSSSAREALWQSLGSLEPFALSQNGSNSLVTGHRWPSLKQNFRVIHRPNGNVMVVSDGLSDPFDDIHEGDGNVNGFLLEFFIETPEAELGSSLTDIKASWQFQLLYTVSQLAAGHGGIRTIIDDMQLLSTEAEGVANAIPEEYRRGLVNRAGRVGALLGLTDRRPGHDAEVPEKIPGMPLTDVKLVNIKLITLSELKLITERGAEGRRKLSEMFDDDSRLVSSLSRPPAL